MGALHPHNNNQDPESGEKNSGCIFWWFSSSIMFLWICLKCRMLQKILWCSDCHLALTRQPNKRLMQTEEVWLVWPLNSFVLLIGTELCFLFRKWNNSVGQCCSRIRLICLCDLFNVSEWVIYLVWILNCCHFYALLKAWRLTWL